MFFPTKYRILNYKLKCKDCEKTIHEESVKILEYDQWWFLRKKREKLPKTTKQKDYAVCEECVKRNNGLVVEEDFCMVRWLNSNVTRTTNACDVMVGEVVKQKDVLTKTVDEIFAEFKKEVKNMLTFESLRKLTPVAYHELESGTYKDKKELKLAIETYLEKTKNFWLIYFSEMLKKVAENQFKEFRALSKEVMCFLKNNNQKIYVEYFYKEQKNLEKEPIAKAYEEINSDIKKAQKRINEKEEVAAKIIELCLKRIMSKQYFRFFSNLVKNRVCENIKSRKMVVDFNEASQQ